MVASETDWAWDLDAVLAAVAATWPDAQIRDGYPLAGSSLRAFVYLPDARADREMAIALGESGQMISLEYRSPEVSAQFVTWVLSRLPPPTTSQSSCSRGNHHACQR